MKTFQTILHAEEIYTHPDRIPLKWSTTLKIFDFYLTDILGQILGVIAFLKFTLSRDSRSTLEKLHFSCQIIIK